MGKTDHLNDKQRPLMSIISTSTGGCGWNRGPFEEEWRWLRRQRRQAEENQASH